MRTLMRRHDETDSQSMREYYESYMREVPCQVCQGRRLKPEVLAVTVDGKSIFDVCDMPVVRELAWVNGLKLEGSAQMIRLTSHSSLPQGCDFFIFTTSPT